MDFDFITEQLDTFATFGGNIGDALQMIPNLLGDLWAFITGFEENLEITSGLSDNLSSTEIGENVDGDDAPNAEDNGSLGSSTEADDADGADESGSSQE